MCSYDEEEGFRDSRCFYSTLYILLFIHSSLLLLFSFFCMTYLRDLVLQDERGVFPLVLLLLFYTFMFSSKGALNACPYNVVFVIIMTIIQGLILGTSLPHFSSSPHLVSGSASSPLTYLCLSAVHSFFHSPPSYPLSVLFCFVFGMAFVVVTTANHPSFDPTLGMFSLFMSLLHTTSTVNSVLTVSRHLFLRTPVDAVIYLHAEWMRWVMCDCPFSRVFA